MQSSHGSLLSRIVASFVMTGALSYQNDVNARCRASNLLGYQAVLANEVGDQLLLGVRHVVASLNTLILPDVWGQVIIIPFQETQYPEQAPWQIHISYASTSR